MRTLIFVLAITCLVFSAPTCASKSGSVMANRTSDGLLPCFMAVDKAYSHQMKYSIMTSISAVCHLGYGDTGSQHGQYSHAIRASICNLAIASHNKQCEAFCFPSNMKAHIPSPPTR